MVVLPYPGTHVMPVAPLIITNLLCTTYVSFYFCFSNSEPSTYRQDVKMCTLLSLDILWCVSEYLVGLHCNQPDKKKDKTHHCVVVMPPRFFDNSAKSHLGIRTVDPGQHF